MSTALPEGPPVPRDGHGPHHPAIAGHAAKAGARPSIDQGRLVSGVAGPASRRGPRADISMEPPRGR